jgi:hypothetical protein
MLKSRRWKHVKGERSASCPQPRLVPRSFNIQPLLQVRSYQPAVQHYSQEKKEGVRFCRPSHSYSDKTGFAAPSKFEVARGKAHAHVIQHFSQSKALERLCLSLTVLFGCRQNSTMNIVPVRHNSASDHSLWVIVDINPFLRRLLRTSSASITCDSKNLEEHEGAIPRMLSSAKQVGWPTAH